MSGLIQSLAIDGTTFPVGLLREIHGLGSPPPRAELYDRAQRHGSVDYTAYYQPRIVDIYDGIVAAGDPDAVWATFEGLKGHLALGSDHVLTFQRAGIPYLERVTCRVATELTGEIVYTSPNLLKWTVSLLCADPRIYSDVLTTARYTPDVSDGGVTFPLTFPLVFSGGSGTDGSVMAVTNNGTFATPPVFTVEGPADAGFSIINETTGEEIVTTGLALAAGDSVTIDVAARTVVVNGTSRPDILDAANTTWFELGPGETLLRLHGSGFSSQDIEATTNLVPNGGFEVDASRTGGSGSVTRTRSTTYAAFGSASLKLTAVSTPDGFNYFHEDTSSTEGGTGHGIPVVGGTPYTASAYLKVPAALVGSGAAVRIRVIEWDATGAVVKDTKSPTNLITAVGSTFDWTRTALTVTTQPSTTNISVRINVDSAAGDVYVDGVQLEQKDHVTDYVDTNGASESREAQVATKLTASFRDARI